MIAIVVCVVLVFISSFLGGAAGSADHPFALRILFLASLAVGGIACFVAASL